jgi:hypothetical protein
MRCRIVSILTAVAAVAVGNAAPAQAGPPVTHREPFGGTETSTECGGRYARVFTFSGTSSVQDTNPSLGGEFFRATDHYRFTEVLTNRTTGESVTSTGSGMLKEMHPTSQAGNVFTFRTHDVARVTFRDEDGTVLLRERGVVVSSVEFDTLGDGQPGGVVLSTELVRVSGPHGTLEPSFDLCDFLDEATT